MIPLTGKVCLKLGPLVLGVLLKHCFDHLPKGWGAVEDEHVDLGAQLKKDDLLYHEFFVVLKVSPII